MAPLNTRSAAVVDVILSNHARGYRNGEMISHHLFPRVSVGSRAMRTLSFGKESFREVNAIRAPGADTKRIQYGYSSNPISLAQSRLQGLVPVEHQEEAMSVPGVSLASAAINMVMDVLDLGLEREAANLALDASKYGAGNKVALTGSDKWSDGTSKPSDDIDEAKEAIRRRIGRYPNTLCISAAVFKALKRHPAIKEQFKYTSSNSITTDMLASYLDIEKVVVGKAVWLPENAGDDDLAQDVWGNDAVLAFVPNSSTGNFMVPSYAYCYELKGYPQVEKPVYDSDRRSWKYPTVVERAAKLTGAEAGFLFKAVV